MKLKNKQIFWDYKSLNKNTEIGLFTYLTRIIMFGEFEKKDLKDIKKYYKKLNIADYWKNYFNLYFKKHDID